MAGVTLDVREQVAIVTIENREVRNGLTPEMCGQLLAVCDEIDEDEAVGAAVVRGADGTFCSGADTRLWTADLDWAGEGFELVSRIYDGFARVGRLAVPTVAAVRGAAVGAGMNLLFACDLRVLADDARLRAGFAKVGLHPGGGFFTLANRLVGREATAALGLFDVGLEGEEAVARGLALEAVPDEQVEPRAIELASVPARDPSLARRTVRSMRQELGPPAIGWEAAIEMERGSQLWSMRRRFRGETDC